MSLSRARGISPRPYIPSTSRSVPLIFVTELVTYFATRLNLCILQFIALLILGDVTHVTALLFSRYFSSAWRKLFPQQLVQNNLNRRLCSSLRAGLSKLQLAVHFFPARKRD
jgi:hypothetical protein